MTPDDGTPDPDRALRMVDDGADVPRCFTCGGRLDEPPMNPADGTVHENCRGAA